MVLDCLLDFLKTSERHIHSFCLLSVVYVFTDELDKSRNILNLHTHTFIFYSVHNYFYLSQKWFRLKLEADNAEAAEKSFSACGGLLHFTPPFPFTYVALPTTGSPTTFVPLVLAVKWGGNQF